MIFAKRYENVIDTICEDVDFRVRQKLVAVMEEFNQPIKLHTSRYDDEDIEETDAFSYACEQFNDIMDAPYISGSFGMAYGMGNGSTNLAANDISFIFSVIELQYKNLSSNFVKNNGEYYNPLTECTDYVPEESDERTEFSDRLNAFFTEYDIPWRILDGKMIKIDAQQFECDLKAKALASMKELKDAEPKFQSAYTELMAAIESLSNEDYQSAINNAGKSYESVLKVILDVNRGNADKLTNQYMDQLLSVPDTMTKSGFREKVMMALPYIRNNSGADHGAGAKEVVISKSMATLAINLSSALNTYLIEEYSSRQAD